MDLNVRNHLEPAKGRFLLAEPFLQEEHFHRSVVFLCEHNEEGTFGFILNKHLEVPPSEITDKIPDKFLRFSLGGPVDNSSLFYIHRSGDLIANSYHVSGDIYLGGDFNDVKSLLNEGKLEENEIIFFLGYSGWSNGQLKDEIEDKSWLVVNSKNPEKHIFSNDDDLWKNIMSEQGSHHKFISKLPGNHLWN